MNIYDEELTRWFLKNPSSQTTVVKCEKCNLYYKPSLGHKCKANCCKKFQRIRGWG